MRTNSVCIVCLITTDDKIYFDIQNTGQLKFNTLKKDLSKLYKFSYK